MTPSGGDAGRSSDKLVLAAHDFPRDAVVATARDSIVRGSRSFAAASRLFDRTTRERAWLLYAWCRRCDDIADGQDHGHGMTIVSDAPQRLARIRALTEAALAGRPVGDPAFDALRIVAAEIALPPALAHDLIAGFALDARGWQPEREDDLYRYCYHVAGVVGRMMALAMGVDAADEPTLARACDLGIAFQLANIARDVEEDAAAGRCYLPRAWLDELGMAGSDHVLPANRGKLALLVGRLAERAAVFEASARRGTPRLGFRSAWAVLAAANIYGAIGRRVAERGSDHGPRVTTSAIEKLGYIAAGWSQALVRRSRYPAAARDPSLWTAGGIGTVC